MVWIEEGFVLQHGACDGSRRSGLAVAALAESGVFGLADRIVLYGDTGPMIERVVEAAVLVSPRIHAAISASPPPPCWKARSPDFLPWASSA